jgi:hypothetical protein
VTFEPGQQPTKPWRKRPDYGKEYRRFREFSPQLARLGVDRAPVGRRRHHLLSQLCRCTQPGRGPYTSRMSLAARGLFRLALIITAAVSSSACFTSETVIKVKADGSGTIEQTHLMNEQMMAMAGAMAGAAAKEAGAQADVPWKVEEWFSEDQLRRQATQWGQGVRFVSHTPLQQGVMKGASAVFAFDDVNTLSMGGTGSTAAGTAAPSGPAMRFGLTNVAGRSVISVTFPESADTAAPSESAGATASTQPPPQIPPEALGMVKTMFAGARLGIDVEVDGRIVSTNAPATTGARATLFAVDFGELLSDPSKLSALQTLKPGVDFATVRKTLGGVKGVTVPAHQVVSIEFAR